jgi:hypothetical protein
LEAIDACLKCSQTAMQLLRRKKIRRDILMQYLAKKSIGVGAGTDKVWRKIYLLFILRTHFFCLG